MLLKDQKTSGWAPQEHGQQETVHLHSAGTARKGSFLFPTRLVGETSKKLTKPVEQTLPLRCLPYVKALLLQGFLNLLVMDNF
jgi:hypothetical protein